MVELPKWIRIPNLPPSTCWHSFGAIAIVPPILEHKQMIYLAKSAIARGVVNLDPGLPPWRPIIVQTALNSRIFTVIRDYISPCLLNEEMQDGFQRDRTVQDAAVLTSLLIERAERRQEELFLISKDCLKCFDRIQAGPDTLSYRIGRRISLQTRHTPAGPEIAVTSWHELRKGSDIWYSPTSREAPSRLRLVPSAGCAILTGDLLRTSRIQRLKFIPWTDTNIYTVELRSLMALLTPASTFAVNRYATIKT
ncbi:hypothetical protein DYB37_007634 [Aphanomyces astaci]|uniref:Uncharacterized protein n=1 Tax=Aphanomyces astaci TaxID=112090 RepID=A0A3R6W6M7_APHAT|nr:hypothetical protein DYB35_009164 [Aphanomyces astaci]RHZ32698.1 hypothetical protein DYB37_007634 [Aphanomyces astaci]